MIPTFAAAEPRWLWYMDGVQCNNMHCEIDKFTRRTHKNNLWLSKMVIQNRTKGSARHMVANTQNSVRLQQKTTIFSQYLVQFISPASFQPSKTVALPPCSFFSVPTYSCLRVLQTGEYFPQFIGKCQDCIKGSLYTHCTITVHSLHTPLHNPLHTHRTITAHHTAHRTAHSTAQSCTLHSHCILHNQKSDR